jgi:hypothetical protein
MDGWMVFDVNFQLLSLRVITAAAAAESQVHFPSLSAPPIPALLPSGWWVSAQQQSTQRPNKITRFLARLRIRTENGKKTLPLNLLTSCRPFR